jgi:glycerol-3-phosphate dehydrogenase
VSVTASPTAARSLPDVANDFACTVADVLVRRTKVAFQTRDHGWSAAPGVAAELAERFGWTTAEVAAALDAYRAEVARIFTIEP